MTALRRAIARLRQESGYGLTDLLVSMTIMLIVLSATLVSFEGLQRNTRANQLQNDAQERARLAIDRLARELRDGASATPELPQGIERAQDYDLIMQTAADGAATGGVRPSRRVRYCLDASAGTIVRQIQGWTGATPPAMPPDTACPGTGWSSTDVVADRVVNTAGGAARPLFLYDMMAADRIRQVRPQVFVDYEPGREPGESKLLSGVFLRNQNRAPVASFTVTHSVDSYVVLNGSASVDPDGDSLTFTWFDGTQQIGIGQVLEYKLPTGTRSISVSVRDPAGQVSSAPAKTVSSP